jgi:DNA-binding Lrp family transcriptional regulator
MGRFLSLFVIAFDLEHNVRTMPQKRNQISNASQKEALDRIDRRIVTALQNNGRLSNKELASQVGLAPSSCLQRVRRLMANDVLRGFHADVAPWALGIELEALIAIRLRNHTRSDVEALRAHLLALEEVAAVYHLAGPDDFLVHVAVADAQHLRNFALDALTSRPEVAHLQTSLIFGTSRAKRMPDYIDRPSAAEPRGLAHNVTATRR